MSSESQQGLLYYDIRSVATKIMGNSLSVNPQSIDGLGTEVPESYNIPRPSAESQRKLDQLIKANNATYGVLFNDKKFHNHLPHALIAAYFLGASANQLTYIYDAASKNLVPWKEDSPHVITDDNWPMFLSDRQCERGYFDYFSDKIGDAKYDWRKIVKSFFVDQDESLMCGLYGGLTHSVIHLGFAFEMDSSYLAAEALTLAATNYTEYNLETPNVDQINNVMDIITEIRNDTTFDGVYKLPSEDGTAAFMERFPEKLAYYTERLEISDPKETLRQLIHAGALLLLATHQDNKPPLYSFFLLHLLTSSQELAEIIFHPKSAGCVPESDHDLLVKNLWTTVVIVYITQMRPLVKLDRIIGVKVDSVPAAWQNTISLVLNGPSHARTDEHFIKAVRSLLFAERFLGDNDGLYVKGALKFAQSFSKNPKFVGFERSELLDIKK